MQAIFQIESYDADICCRMMKIYGEANADLMEYVPLSVTFRMFCIQSVFLKPSSVCNFLCKVKVQIFYVKNRVNLFYTLKILKLILVFSQNEFLSLQTCYVCFGKHIPNQKQLSYITNTG